MDFLRAAQKNVVVYMRDQSSSRTRRGRAQSMRECHAHSPEECPRQDAALARPTWHSVAPRIPRGRPRHRTGEHQSRGVRGVRKKKEPTAQTTPGRGVPPLHPRRVTLAMDGGCFRGAKKRADSVQPHGRLSCPEPNVTDGVQKGSYRRGDPIGAFFRTPRNGGQSYSITTECHDLQLSTDERCESRSCIPLS